MKLYILMPFLFFLCSCGNTGAKKDAQLTGDSRDTVVKESTKLLRHVVLFNFNEEATTEAVKKIEKSFASLPDQIAQIHSFEWGTNNSPEGLDKGLSHCFFVTFLSEEDRAIYLPHPAHKAFVELVGPYVEDVTVVDYWVE